MFDGVIRPLIADFSREEGNEIEKYKHISSDNLVE